MKIQTINNLPLYNVNVGQSRWQKQITYINPAFCGRDKVELKKHPSPFKVINSVVAENLYYAEYEQSGNFYEEDEFPAYVLDKKTGKAVEVVFKPVYKEDGEEEFYLLDPHNLTGGGEFSKAGRIYLSDNIKDKTMVTDAMASYARERYEGVGIIEHQLAIERMLGKGCSHYQLNALPAAYDFHKKCGFEIINNEDYYHLYTFDMVTSIYANKLNMDKDKVRELMVYKKVRDDCYVVNTNKSFENFIKYANENNLHVSTYFCVDMKLSRAALKDWKKLIKKHPILKGKSLPEKIERNADSCSKYKRLKTN